MRMEARALGECNRAPQRGQGISRLVSALCALALLSGPHASQAVEDGRYSRAAERLFSQGLAACEEGHWRAASERFAAVTELPANHRSMAALLMLGRSRLRLDDAAGAVRAARRLLRESPGGRYAGDARMVAGDGYYVLGRHDEAALEYARLLEGSGPVALQASAAERLAGMVRNRSLDTEMQDRIRRLGSRGMRHALLYGEARWYGRLGWVELARSRLSAYIDSAGETGMFHRLARSALEGGAPDRPPREPAAGKPARRRGVPRLGVLAPFSGREGAIGVDLLEGVELANDELGKPFDIVVVDTGAEYEDFEEEEVPIYQSDGDRLVRVVSGARFLAGEADVQAIVGPVFSPSCAAAAAVAEAAGVPLIAPLAQQSGLDTLGRHIFQLNPIPEVQGQALAEYATLVLGLHTLAILSPLSDDGHAFEKAFTAAAVANGGRIVHSEWYYPGEQKDFQAQFQELRQIGFSLELPERIRPELLDSLEGALLDTSLEGESTFRELVDQAVVPVEEPPDSAEIFIESIDGAAVIIELFEDARTIAPQLRFHRIQTQLLGNDRWYDPEAISEFPSTERQHVKGCIFVSRRQGSEHERNFVDAFRSRTGRDPGYASAGYDAARLVMEGWRAGHHSRTGLRRYLADLRHYEGASGRVSFGPSRRVNSELTLLRIDGRGRVRPLKREDLPVLVLEETDDLPAEAGLPGGG